MILNKKITQNSKFWVFVSLCILGFFYLNLIWRTSGDFDYLFTNLLFYFAILWLILKHSVKIKLNFNLASSFIGLILLVIFVVKAIYLFSFEYTLLALFPFGVGVSLALIASGFNGLREYWQELFFAWFLFFPEGVIGNFLDNIIKITVLNAKFSTYFLYYFGFDVKNFGNEVILSLPNIGEYKAIVDYPCAGMPMILLMLKLSLLLVSFFPVTKLQRFSLPTISVAIGFLLGVIRVCILTLVIPEQTAFDYWHGFEGSQIFSTLAIIIFSGYAYWSLNKSNVLSSSEVT